MENIFFWLFALTRGRKELWVVEGVRLPIPFVGGVRGPFLFEQAGRGHIAGEDDFFDAILGHFSAAIALLAAQYVVDTGEGVLDFIAVQYLDNDEQIFYLDSPSCFVVFAIVVDQFERALNFDFRPIVFAIDDCRFQWFVRISVQEAAQSGRLARTADDGKLFDVARFAIVLFAGHDSSFVVTWQLIIICRSCQSPANKNRPRWGGKDYFLMKYHEDGITFFAPKMG